MEELHKSSIRVSDIASQYWCERQMEFNYRYGQRLITEQVKSGRKVHEELEEKTNVPIILQPKSYADAMYKNLYTSYAALAALKKNKVTREVQIYGSFGGFKVVGKIDQLDLRDGGVVILEHKTRANSNIPSEAQMLTHKIQVMTYKKMFDDIQKGRYTIHDFLRGYRTGTLKLTGEFVRQLEALGVGRNIQDIDMVSTLLFREMRSLGEASDTLYIKYLNQYTGKEISLHKLQYSEQEMQGIIKYILKYWTGERKSMPVPEQEKWKCNYCVFFGKECKVWWPQKELKAV